MFLKTLFFWLKVIPTLLFLLGAYKVNTFIRLVRGKAPHTITVGDVQYEKVSQFAPARQGQGIALSPNGKYIAVIGLFGRNILIYRPDGTLVRDIPRTDTYPAPEIFFRNDREVVAPAGDAAGNEAMLEVWDVEHESSSRVVKGSYPGKGRVYNRAKKYAVAGDHVVVFSNGADGDQMTLVNLSSITSRCINLSKLLGEKTRIQKTAISPDGRFIAITTTASRLLIIKFSDARLLQNVEVYSSSTVIGGVAFSPDGKRVITIKGANHSESGKEWIMLERNESIKIWDTQAGKLLHSVVTGDLTVRQASWSRDGNTIAAIQANEDLPLLLFPVTSKERDSLSYKVKMRYISSANFASNADLLAVLTVDKVVIYQKKST